MAPQVNNLRPQVTEKDIVKTLAAVEAKLRSRLAKKGWGAYASRHEILGIVTEEYLEAVDAIREDGQVGYDHYSDELMDITVAGLFGYTSMKLGHIRA